MNVRSKSSHQRKIIEERRNAIKSGRQNPIEVPASPATVGGGGSVPAVPVLTAAPGSAGSGAREPRRRGIKTRTGDGGVGGKESETPKRTALQDVPCYFHSVARYGVGNGCSKGAECQFSHSKLLNKKDFEAAERPRPVSASRRSGKGGGKGKSSSRPPAKRTTPLHCSKFLNQGVCPFEQEGKKCKYPHLTREQYDAEVARMKAAAAAAEKK